MRQWRESETDNEGWAFVVHEYFVKTSLVNINAGLDLCYDSLDPLESSISFGVGKVDSKIEEHSRDPSKFGAPLEFSVWVEVELQSLRDELPDLVFNDVEVGETDLGI